MLTGVVVLIAEDEPLIALDMENAVLVEGGQVLGSATSVQEARQLIENNDIHVALMDFNLLDGDTQAIAALLIEKRIPVVFHTGVGLPAEFTNTYPDTPIFSKPTTMGRLMRSLRSELDKAAAQ